MTSDCNPASLSPNPSIVAPSDEEAAHIVTQFGKGEMLSCDSLQVGFVNWNAAVETSQGRFFLKQRHPALADPELVDSQQRLIEHIRAESIPAPQIYHTTQGLGWVEHDRRIYELHQWVEGQQYDPNDEAHLSAVGEMLARYHLAVRDFEPGEPLLRRYGWLYGPQVMRRMLAVVEQRWPEMDEWWSHVRKQADRIEEAHPQQAQLEPLVMHGDYYANSILFEGREIVALLDYDNAAYQNRVVEVAEALIYFGKQPDKRLTAGVYGGLINLDKARRFMEAYNALWPLGDNERQALAATIEAIWLTVSLLRLDERAEPDRAEVLERLQAMRLLSDWAYGQRGELLEVAGAKL